MNEQEAIKILDWIETVYRDMYRGTSNVSEAHQAMTMAKAAIKLHEAKPVEWQERTNRYNETTKEPFCPACGCMVGEDNYCGYCGQKLLWED